MPELPTFTSLKFGSSPIQFLKEVKKELAKVHWPSQQEVIKMTGVVLIVSALVSLYISALDFLFTKTMEVLVK